MPILVLLSTPSVASDAPFHTFPSVNSGAGGSVSDDSNIVVELETDSGRVSLIEVHWGTPWVCTI